MIHVDPPTDPAGEKTVGCLCDTCVARRREPWLPGGFEMGAQWYSYDGGLTWERMPDSRRVHGEPSEQTMTVTGIDQKTGTVTIVVK